MKAINLKALIDARESLPQDTFEKYLSLYGITLARQGNNDEVKEEELDCLKAFANHFAKEQYRARLLDNFFIGYKIPQIGKEFDLLRINNDNIVSVELKSEASEAKILKQLKRNLFYLKSLNKEVVLFTYVQESDTLYKLTDDANLIRLEDFTSLFDELRKENDEEEDIDKLFNPCNYLISPFNSTERFVEDEYFLTKHQEEIKREILKLVEGDETCFISLTGAAGTGKTLLTYDIAKELRKRERKVLIVHCGLLNKGQKRLKEEYGWDICIGRQISAEILKDFDVVMVDEAQRLKMYQFERIRDNVAGMNKKYIFSYDEKQWINRDEKKLGVLNVILKLPNLKSFNLTNSIRINKEVASFTKLLFDKSKPIEHIDYSNIDLYYFSECDEVIGMAKSLKEKGWMVVNYTPGTYSKFRYQRYCIEDAKSAHEVIGQEFDNVVAIIDDSFSYDNNKLLAGGSCYSQRQMLYQILTRTRLRLSIIIFNNEIMMKRCLEILGK